MRLIDSFPILFLPQVPIFPEEPKHSFVKQKQRTTYTLTEEKKKKEENLAI